MTTTMSAKRFPQTRLPVVVYTRHQRSLYTAPVVGGNPRNGPTIQSQAPRILADAGKGSEQHSSNAANHSNHNAILALPYPYAGSSTHAASNPLPSSHPNPHYLFNSNSSQTSTQSKHSSTKRRIKKGPKYQLDVGAYGIPKKASPTSLRHMHTDASLSVGVGEDAYFVRGDAIGVADGVGGWAKVGSSSTSAALTPSALFAKHIMHYCSAEIRDIREAKSQSSSLTPPSSNPTLNHFLSSSPFYSPFSSPFYSPLSSQWAPFSTPAPPEPIDELHDMEQQLSDELEELEEGIDVLMILERAYQKTLDVHVTDPAESRRPTPSFAGTSVPSQTSLTEPTYHESWPASPTPSFSSNNVDSAEKVPIMAGSSTVLLAVLDHVPKGQLEVEVEIQSKTNHSDGPGGTVSDELQAVVKVAHVGDCMGMLVRGNEIVWRSEEMWWNFNTPVQLGPLSPITPATTATSAQSFTLPVQADDILILASDGLSDNLWDEDVIDEVNRFRQGGWLISSSSDASGNEATAVDGLLRRRTLAGMLSEALCSRAKKVSARKRSKTKDTSNSASVSGTSTPVDTEDYEEETPFGRRAREAGRHFRGGKGDDISVVVAVISPAKDSTSRDQTP